MSYKSFTMPLILLVILVGAVVVFQAAHYDVEREQVDELIVKERELYESNALLISNIDRHTPAYMKDWKRELFKEEQ